MFVPQRAQSTKGQMLALFGLSLVVILLGVGLVIDGGTALVQRRASQNASDFAALAGARVVAEWIGGDTTNGTDATVQAAITNSISVNAGAPIAFGGPNGPAYVDANGATTGYVGGGGIPAGTVGVTVQSSRTWTPYFLGIIGMKNWAASAAATARGGYAAGGPGSNVFPVGIADAFFNGRLPCAGPVSNNPASNCYPQHLTPGDLNVPGGFGWLKFGATGKCTGYGLGMDPNNGCSPNKPFLQTEIGPPANSFGCCSAVSANDTAPANRIGSLPGNKASADCTYYIVNNVVVTVPVWDYAGGTGDNAWYHIIGFTGFQLTACDGGKDIEGVYRQPFFVGPTTSTPGFPGAPLAVQLVR